MYRSTKTIICLLLYFCGAGLLSLSFPQSSFGQEAESDSSDKTGWSKPAVIPIDLDDRIPAGPDIAASAGNLYLTFQTFRKELFASHDVWLMRKENGSWNAPELIAETSLTADGTRVAVSNHKKYGDVVHLVWWDKPSDRKYSTDSPLETAAASEIWYVNCVSGKCGQPVRLFEGNALTPSVAKPEIIGKEKILYVSFFAGKDGVRDGRPSFFILRKEHGDWTTPVSVIDGAGHDGRYVLMNDHEILLAYTGVEYSLYEKFFERDWRGIFLKKSTNRGETWSEPMLTGRTELPRTPASRPNLVFDREERIHLFWIQDTTGDHMPDNLIHTWSDDGQHWHDHQWVTGVLKEGNRVITNYDIATTPEGAIHLVYELHSVSGESGSTLVHTVLRDGVWITSDPLFEAENAVHPVLVSDDYTNRLHLVFGVKTRDHSGQAGRQTWYDEKFGMVIPAQQDRSTPQHITEWRWYHSVLSE